MTKRHKQIICKADLVQHERNRLRQILDSQFGFVVVLSLDGVVVEVNQALLTFMSLQRAEVLGCLFWEIGWLEPGSEVQAQMAIQAAARGEVVRGDILARFPGLGRRDVDAIFSPLKDAAGSVINVIGFGIDITERKQAEDMHRAAEMELRALFQAMTAVVLVLDAEGRYLKIAPTNPALLIQPPAELVGSTIFEVLPPAKANTIHSYIKQALATGQAVHVEYTLPIRDKDVWFHGVVSPISENNVLWVAHDITERKQMEEALRASELRLNEAQRIAKVGSWELDLVSGKLLWSDEVFHIFEIDQTLFATSYEAFLNMVHPQDRDAVNQAYNNSLATHSPYEITHRLLLPDGRIKWVNDRCETFYDDQGKALRSVGTSAGHH